MVPRLWVPLIHSLPARNWNSAACGAALTASRVAKRVAVSTPLRVDSLTVVVISVLLRCGPARARRAGVRLTAVWSGDGQFALAWNWAGGRLGRLDVDGPAELLLQCDELRNGWVGGHGGGQFEDLPHGLIALVLITGQGGAFLGLTAQCLVQGDGEQRPAGAMGPAHLVGGAQHAGDR